MEMQHMQKDNFCKEIPQKAYGKGAITQELMIQPGNARSDNMSRRGQLNLFSLCKKDKDGAVL